MLASMSPLLMLIDETISSKKHAVSGIYSQEVPISVLVKFKCCCYSESGNKTLTTFFRMFSLFISHSEQIDFLLVLHKF